MHQTCTVVVNENGGVWIGWIEEVPGVNCRGATREELFETLKVPLAEAVELNRQEAVGAAGERYEELPIDV